MMLITLQLGGTIGDIEGMPFVEAFRQLQFRVKPENFSCVHVSLIPQVSHCMLILGFHWDNYMMLGCIHIMTHLTISLKCI